MVNKFQSILSVFGLLLFVACQPEYVPKPRAFYRISLPEKEYQRFDASCPYSFDYPTYAQVVPDMEGDEAFCWLNVEYTDLNAVLHISYKPIIEEGDFQHLITDAYTFVEKHNIKAERITEEKVENKGYDASGLLFRIGGNTASNIQFFLTDSTKNFVRASLYFNCEPNKDSLAPVVDFIAQDIDKMISSFQWTGQTLQVYR